MPAGIVVADLATWLRAEEASIDAGSAGMAIAAVVAHIEKRYDPWRYHPGGVAPDPEPDAWSDDELLADLYLGTVMLIAKYARRPDSPSGTITFDGFSSPVAAYDGDITRLLSPYEVVKFG